MGVATLVMIYQMGGRQNAMFAAMLEKLLNA